MSQGNVIDWPAQPSTLRLVGAPTTVDAAGLTALTARLRAGTLLVNAVRQYTAAYGRELTSARLHQIAYGIEHVPDVVPWNEGSTP